MHQLVHRGRLQAFVQPVRLPVSFCPLGRLLAIAEATKRLAQRATFPMSDNKVRAPGAARSVHDLNNR